VEIDQSHYLAGQQRADMVQRDRDHGKAAYQIDPVVPFHGLIITARSMTSGDKTVTCRPFPDLRAVLHLCP
jgi:hypothetical protein